jgi:hypothetical protein
MKKPAFSDKFHHHISQTVTETSKGSWNLSRCLSLKYSVRNLN